MWYILPTCIVVDDREIMPARRKDYHGPVEATVDILAGRWKPLILWALRDGTLRFGQIEEGLSAYTPNITQRMLTRQLRELEDDGLIVRKVYPEVPPRVEYTLTERYMSLMPIVAQMYAWGNEHMADQIAYDDDGKRK
jgi:DNA-binding HxlR family transcriptional regulator